MARASRGAWAAVPSGRGRGPGGRRPDGRTSRCGRRCRCRARTVGRRCPPPASQRGRRRPCRGSARRAAWSTAACRGAPQRHRDPFGVLEMLADRSSAWPIIDTCRAAWRLSRCPLVLLMPLIWEVWIARCSDAVIDDPFPPVSHIGDLPGYAIDQFTRAGIQVSRRLLARDAELQRLLVEGGVARSDQHRTVGDLIFLVEGGALARRTIWPTGDALRLPYRCLADTVALGSLLPEAVQRVARQGPLIGHLREQFLTPSQRRQELQGALQSLTELLAPNLPAGLESSGEKLANPG